ncbi:hypothetical protein H2203_004718 [Taxawa tesnikishii (nom. ined.)]|nr:hypothetical protein H2203_004718 [Dothideales sp. JES 119]
MVDGKPEAKVLGQTTAEGFGTIAADTLTNAHLSEGVQAVSAAAEKIKDLPMDEVAGQIQDTAKAMHDVTQYVRQLPLDEATKSIRTAADATTTTAESANAALKVGRGLLHAATAVQAVSIPLMCINAYNQKIEATAKTKQAEILACQVHLEHESRTYGLSPTARAQSFLDICEHWDCYVRKKFLEDRPSSTVKTYLVGVSTVDLTPLWKLAEKKQGFRDLLVVPTKPGYETFQEAIDAADAHTNRRSQDQKRTDTYHIFILISDGEPRLCRPETHHVAIPHSLAPKDLFIVGLGSKGKKSAHAIDERSTVETELARRSPFAKSSARTRYAACLSGEGQGRMKRSSKY